MSEKGWLIVIALGVWGLVIGGYYAAQKASAAATAAANSPLGSIASILSGL